MVWERIAFTLAAAKAVIVRNRGLFTFDGPVRGAAWWFTAPERGFQAQLLGVGGLLE